MGVIKIVKGDVTELLDNGTVELIAHGANCQNVMGAGIAKLIKQKYPEAFAADTEYHSGRNPEDMAGWFSVGHLDGGKKVVNLYTQIQCGANARYSFLCDALKHLNFYCKSRSIKRIALPLIGAGIGGLDAEAVVNFMAELLPDVDVIVCVYTKGDEIHKFLLDTFTNYSLPMDLKGNLKIINGVVTLNGKPFDIKFGDATMLADGKGGRVVNYPSDSFDMYGVEIV